MNKLIVANWKMNTTLSEALVLVNGVKEGIRSLHGVDVVLCPPFPWLVPAAEALNSRSVSHLMLGAQNIFWKEEGAYTGEVSAKMLKGLVSHIIIGHSERRKHFKETDRELGVKLKIALENGITPILCIGERRRPADRYLDEPEQLVSSHFREMFGELRHALDQLTDDEKSKVVVAYEPVWAISTSSSDARPATGVYAAHVCACIKEQLERMGGSRMSQVPVLYGGSANPANAKEFLAHESINGLLVGGASLKVQSFLGVCQSV